MLSRLLLLSASCSITTALEALPSGESTHTVTFGSRSSTIIVENGGSRRRASPLVLFMHGWFGSGNTAFCRSSKFADHARQMGYIGVCPDGSGAGNSQKSWNAAGCCGKTVSQKVDDVGFLKAVVAWVKERTSVSKVYATGISNGAMISWRLMCEASDVFDGVAPVAGGYFGAPPEFKVSSSVRVPNGWVTSSSSCSSSDYPGGSASRCWTPNSFTCRKPANGYPLLHIHGTRDTEEPFELVIAQYKFYAENVLGCSGEQEVYVKGNAKCYEYQNCAHKSALCIVDGLGHNMPSSTHGFDGIETAFYYWHGGWTSSVLNRTIDAPAVENAAASESSNSTSVWGRHP